MKVPMKKSLLLPIKILIIIGLAIGFLSFNDSLAPERSQVQKVYDDFIAELEHRAATPQNQTIAPEVEAGLPLQPEALIEIGIKDHDNVQVLKYQLDWLDRTKLMKALRVLDLLRLGNAFSQQRGVNEHNATVKIKVVASSGYKFESYLTSQEVVGNSPLALAIVLMREIS